jgi:hypothetical protein
MGLKQSFGFHMSKKQGSYFNQNRIVSKLALGWTLDEKWHHCFTDFSKMELDKGSSGSRQRVSFVVYFKILIFR